MKKSFLTLKESSHEYNFKRPWTRQATGMQAEIITNIMLKYMILQLLQEFENITLLVLEASTVASEFDCDRCSMSPALKGEAPLEIKPASSFSTQIPWIPVSAGPKTVSVFFCQGPRRGQH